MFCVICPLIAPIAAFYFAMNYIVWKYQHVYVYNPAYQSGGMAWVRVFDQCMWGMIFFHLLMVGILGLKESIGAPILVAILWIFDLVFWVAAHKRFWPPQECLSLISAADIDDKEAALKSQVVSASQKSIDEEVRRRYLSPSFKFNEGEHEQAMDEVRRMQAVLAGGEDEALLAAPPSEHGVGANGSEAGDIEAPAEAPAPKVTVTPVAEPAATPAAVPATAPNGDT